MWQQPTLNETTLNVLAYGPSGTGKTVFAGSFPDPIVLDTENGWKSISAIHGYTPYRVAIDSKAAILDAYRELKKGDHPFQTVIVDSVTDLVKFMLDDVIEKNPGRKRPAQGVPGREDYSEVIANLERCLRLFRDLPMHTVFLALPKTVQDEGTGETTTLPSVVGQVSEKLPALVDVAMFTGVQEVEPSDQYPEGKRYFGQTIPAKGRSAKDRSGRLSTPFCDLGFNVLAEAFGLQVRESYASSYGVDPEPAKKPRSRKADAEPVDELVPVGGAVDAA